MASYPGSTGDLVCSSWAKLITNCIYASASDDFAAYRLNMVNFEENQDTDTVLTNKSDFSVSARAVSIAYNVLDGLPFEESNPQFNYTDDGGHAKRLYVRDWARGCVTYITDLVSQRGAWCTRMPALQAKQAADNATNKPSLGHHVMHYPWLQQHCVRSRP